MLHNSLREIQTTIKWPATPQEIAETNDDINTNFFNLITALLPSTLPSKENGQKTRSSDVVDTLNRLEYGTSSCETLFVEDKWAKWSQYQ